jgi:hypothetical protein
MNKIRNTDLAMSLKGRTLIDGVTGTTQPVPALPTLSAVNDNKESAGNGALPAISTYNNMHHQQQQVNMNQHVPSQVNSAAVGNQELPTYSGAAPLYRQQQGWPQAQQPPPFLQQPQQYGGTHFEFLAYLVTLSVTQIV